jgi:hypothetical protein
VKPLDAQWRRRVEALLRMGDCLAAFVWPANMDGRAYVLVCLCCMEQAFGALRGAALPAAGELHEQMFFRFPEQLYRARNMDLRTAILALTGVPQAAHRGLSDRFGTDTAPRRSSHSLGPEGLLSQEGLAIADVRGWCGGCAVKALKLGEEAGVKYSGRGCWESAERRVRECLADSELGYMQQLQLRGAGRGGGHAGRARASATTTAPPGMLLGGRHAGC